MLRHILAFVCNVRYAVHIMDTISNDKFRGVPKQPDDGKRIHFKNYLQ